MLKALLSLLTCCLLANLSHAAGLVQITLNGQIYEDAGARVEFLCESGDRRVEFNGVLGFQTRPGDLAALLGVRLKAAGFSVSMGPDGGPTGPLSFFVDHCETIRIRGGKGLTARLTAVDEVPVALEVLPPRSISNGAGGELRTFLTLHNSGTKLDSVAELVVQLPEARQSGAWVSERLSAAAMAQGLKSNRPTSLTWVSTGSQAGAKTVGLSVEFLGDSDWGIELQFAPLVKQR